MKLPTQFATLLLCLFLTGCSSAPESPKPVKTVILDTRSTPENLTIYLNDEPTAEKTNNGELRLSIPEGQTNIIKVKDEKPFGTVTYGVEIPQESNDPVSIKIEPPENKELNLQLSNFLKDYFTAVNQKKNAPAYLSEDTIYNSKNIYNNSFKKAVLYTSTLKPLKINDKVGLIVSVDAETRKNPSTTFTYRFRLLWEEGKWKVFHQQVLYEVLGDELLFELEKGTYPGKQSPGPDDIVLIF